MFNYSSQGNKPTPEEIRKLQQNNPFFEGFSETDYSLDSQPSPEASIPQEPLMEIEIPEASPTEFSANGSLSFRDQETFTTVPTELSEEAYTITSPTEQFLEDLKTEEAISTASEVITASKVIVKETLLEAAQNLVKEAYQVGKDGIDAVVEIFDILIGRTKKDKPQTPEEKEKQVKAQAEGFFISSKQKGIEAEIHQVETHKESADEVRITGGLISQDDLKAVGSGEKNISSLFSIANKRNERKNQAGNSKYSTLIDTGSKKTGPEAINKASERSGGGHWMSAVG